MAALNHSEYPLMEVPVSPLLFIIRVSEVQTIVRFLPENSTICRIQCQFVDRDENVVEGTPQLDLLPDNDSSAYFPQYMNSTQIDLPPIIDGTMMAYIKIFTIDRHTRQLVTVGFAVFNIFITEMNEDRDGGIQPCTADERPICLNDGYHQIPVYNWTSKTTFKDSGGLQVSGIRNQRVPCCSLLLRISAGQDLPIKQYKERVYISTLCTPLPYESGIFYFLVRERPLNATIRAALQQLKQDVQAANDEALVIWMARRIAKEKGVIPPMDLSCILKFHEGWGFKISIDMAENLKNKAFSIATLCLSPPAILYASKRKSIMNATMEDVMYNQKLNFSTTVRSPEWKDGFLWYRKYPFNSRLLAVVDIRCLGYSEQDKQYRLQSQGWTLLPVFHDSGFVKYGTYQLPLFDGLPTPDLLDQFSKSEIDTDELIAQNIKSKVIRYAKRHGTVFVRICDGRRERELPFVKVVTPQMY
ncbi:hypothetical protein BDR26DRAFT_489859 [Obelidium mucronatum]|nr:hypothetical protein BDR26DRAFT_489859 [Obelidium mucronatum]